MAEIRAYLTLIGDEFDVDYVSKEMKMDPDEIRKKDEILRNGSLFGHTEWGLETRLEIGDEVEPVLRQLINRTISNVDTMRKLSKELHAAWHILILLKVYNASPAIILPLDILQYAVEIGAGIGFDTYVLT